MSETDTGMTPAALKALIDGDLGNAMAAMLPGGIEAQEAAGQASVCGTKDRLPVRGTLTDNFDGPKPELRGQWESLGFMFGKFIPEERRPVVFVECEFPPGWSLRPCNHSMWSELLDPNGGVRGLMFFKAAFYDYHAHISLRPRYEVGIEYDCDKTGDHSQQGRTYGVRDNATGELIQIIGRYDSYDASRADGADYKAEDWLKENFPDHRNPLAYWD